MKKVFLAATALLCFGATQMNAQTISGGVKAEANISNFILSDMPGGAKSEMGFGASVGGFAKFDLTRNFAIQPELLFHFQSSDYKAKSGEKTRGYEYWGIELPVYAMGQWYTNAGHRFYAGVGPYVGLGLDARFSKPETKLYKNDILQPWDFGFKAAIGYEFANGIQINAGYKIGIINAVDKGDGKMLPEAVSLGVGYRF